MDSFALDPSRVRGAKSIQSAESYPQGKISISDAIGDDMRVDKGWARQYGSRPFLARTGSRHTDNAANETHISTEQTEA
jgi:hypothetical protein